MQSRRSTVERVYLDLFHILDIVQSKRSTVERI
jgi:hypothetical protein